MQYENDYLQEVDKRLNTTNVKHSHYYYRMYLDTHMNKFLRKSNAVKDCMSYWRWNAYDLNKILDLQKVTRCKDTRFCPNCRDMSVAYAIHNFRPAFELMLHRNYVPLFVTFTVPNCSGEELRSMLDKMQKSYRKLWLWFNAKTDNNSRGCYFRYLQFKACIKCIEVNVQQDNNNYYHPHYHCIVFIDSNDYYENIELFEKKIPGPWRKKSNDYIKYSEVDLQIMKLWRIAFEGIRLNKISYDNYSDNWWELYQCDVREFDMKNKTSIYEVFKYPFKDKDLTFGNFKTLHCALEGRRMRQGHGELYNLDLESEDGELQELDLKYKETPRELIHRELSLLYKEYHDYVKISRFGASVELNSIKENCN